MRDGKFKLAFITPTAFIGKYGNQGDFHLGLSHLIDADTPNDYEKALVDSGLPIILDNGTFENGIPEEVDSLLKKAIRIKATHVFAPDYLYNAEKTRDALGRTIVARHKLKSQGYVPKIAAVCQADHLEEYLAEYRWMDRHPDIDLIGISILTIPHVMENHRIDASRQQVLDKLRTYKPTKPAHLLGLGDSYTDVLYAAERCDWVVSNDTSSCFQNGLYGRKIYDKYLAVEGGKVEQKVDFDLKVVDNQQHQTIQQNIDTVKSRFNQIG